jgi:hypothetical protein
MFSSMQDPVEMLGDVYLSDNLADAAQAWNEWRREVVDYAVREKVVPALLQVCCGLWCPPYLELPVGCHLQRWKCHVLGKRVLSRDRARDWLMLDCA